MSGKAYSPAITATFLLTAMLVWLFSITSVQAAASRSLQEGLHLGNAAYGEGRFQEAIAIYSALIDEYGFSPELLHNLANSYAAAGENGRAILHYLQGLRIAPGDDDLQADLELIRQKAGLFDQEHSFTERLFRHYNMNQWLTSALAFYGLFTLLLGLNLRLHFKKALSTLGPLLVCAMLFCCLGAYVQKEEWYSGVIVAPDARLLLSPFQESSTNGSLAEGTLVFAEKSHEGYLYVRDQRGRSGWVNGSYFARINTSAATFHRDGVEPDSLRQ
ncbi:MAG: tetratricopeptide repeat protein [Desulfocapsaceae bacterium]|nr:tetratricopeptide repeat protein [Desulfocapsaceae bacterium]